MPLTPLKHTATAAIKVLWVCWSLFVLSDKRSHCSEDPTRQEAHGPNQKDALAGSQAPLLLSNSSNCGTVCLRTPAPFSTWSVPTPPSRVPPPPVIFNPSASLFHHSGNIQGKCTQGRLASGLLEAQLEDTLYPHLSGDTQKRVRRGNLNQPQRRHPHPAAHTFSRRACRPKGKRRTLQRSSSRREQGSWERHRSADRCACAGGEGRQSVRASWAG